MKKLLIIFAAVLLSLIPTSRLHAAEYESMYKTSRPHNLGHYAMRNASSLSDAEYDTMYNIGSVSKVFTAAAVMRLVDMGLVSLDTPVVAYVSDFTMADTRYVYITPRMLLNHSSGLMGTVMANAFLLGDNSTYYMENFLDIISRQRLMFDPGQRSIYNNDGFTLAEILIERVSGINFTEFLEREFFYPLGIQGITSPQSSTFDPNRLAHIFVGPSQLQPQMLGVIGSGGLLATMEDLARFSTIFMDDAEIRILSRESVNEMASLQIRMDLLPNANSTSRFGLGWDAVDMYPFNTLGIQALSKGGGTMAFTTDLTVLPEFNLAVAISSSSQGGGGAEATISQAIILAVLMEEGLIPHTTISLPELNIQPAPVPESIKAYAGTYDLGAMGGMFEAYFTDYTLVLTPIAQHGDRPLEFLFNTDGVFVSTDGSYLMGRGDSAHNVSIITFEGYMLVQTYSDIPGIGHTVVSMPMAQKLDANPVSAGVQAAWEARSGREFLLVSDRHTSMNYIVSPRLDIMVDDAVPGYVIRGLGGGVSFPNVRMIDENSALAFNTTPIMHGRDAVDIRVGQRHGQEYISVNNGEMIFINAAFARYLSQIGNSVIISHQTIWVDIDAYLAGEMMQITTPQNGAWFVYDYHMNVIATSLEMYPRSTIILPEGGRLAFAGEPGAEFVLSRDSYAYR